MTDSLAAHPAAVTSRRRWIALVFISIAQLMVIFDASIMNIALPQAQLDLAFNDADPRSWPAAHQPALPPVQNPMNQPCPRHQQQKVPTT